MADDFPLDTDESKTLSSWSPGPVDCSEDLARLIYRDEQLDVQTGEIKIGAFPLEDVVRPERGGWSLCRLKYSSESAIRSKGELFEQRHPDNKFRGVSVGCTRSIREISIPDGSGKRPILVVDDGLPDDPSHCLIKQVLLAPATSRSEIRAQKAKLKPVREQVWKLISPLTSV